MVKQNLYLLSLYLLTGITLSACVSTTTPAETTKEAITPTINLDADNIEQTIAPPDKATIELPEDTQKDSEQVAQAVLVYEDAIKSLPVKRIFNKSVRHPGMEQGFTEKKQPMGSVIICKP